MTAVDAAAAAAANAAAAAITAATTVAAAATGPIDGAAATAASRPLPRLTTDGACRPVVGRPAAARARAPGRRRCQLRISHV